MNMRPRHNPKPGGSFIDTKSDAWKERWEEQWDFYYSLRDQAECIPYKNVTDSISRKIADHLQYPSQVQTSRWTDVMAKLGYGDQVLQAKLRNYEYWPPGKEANSAFFLFLSKYFAPDGHTLWQLLEALMVEDCGDVLQEIRPDISNFISTYRPESKNGQVSTIPEPNSLDSGVGPSMSSVGSEPTQHVRKSINMLDPGVPRPDLDLKFQATENKSGNESHFFPKDEDSFTLKKEPFADQIFRPYFSEDDEDPFSFDEKQSKRIKVTVIHTEADEEIAEELARELNQDYQLRTYLLKNLFPLISLDQGLYVMKMLQSMDFLIPVLSKAYLKEILPDRDASDMNYDSSLIRYIHASSQARVINRNSLNYLIRPVMANDVSYNMVREWYEFQCAVKYPKDLGRLAKNLKDTKQFLRRR